MTTDHRRRRVAELRDEGLSVRAIAKALKVGVGTVHRDLKAGVPAPLPGLQTSSGRPVAGATAGNTRSLKSGAESPRLISPRAEELLPTVFEANPHLDDVRDRAAVLRYAVLLARIERAYGWLIEQDDDVFADRRAGEFHPIFGRLERWERSADRCEANLAISPGPRAKLGLDRVRGEGLAAYLREHYPAKEGKDDER
jgi:Helix-turn-helix domain